MGLVNDLGNSINAANATALKDMINLANVAAGQTITVNDVALGTAQYNYSSVSDRWMKTENSTTTTVTDLNEIKELNKASGFASVIGDGSVSNGTADQKAAAVNGTTVTRVDGIIVDAGGSIQAGGLVELQFKIDQMMAAVQEGIKNTGKVSQTREGAARA